MTDAEIQAAIDRAARYLVSELKPIVLIQDVDALASRLVATLMSGPDRWRPVPLPPDRLPPGTGAPPSPEFRRVLAELHNTPREETDQ